MKKQKLTKKENTISINLNCYTIRFRKKKIKDEFLKVNEVITDFEESIRNFIKTIDTETYVNELGDRILYLEKTLLFKNTLYTGILRKGHSGQESNVDEVKNFKVNTVNKIGKDQYNSIPFYFLLSHPTPESKHLIFLAQSYKQYGFKEIFELAFKEFINKYISNEEIICEIGTLSIAKLFDKYVNDGNIRKLRFVKHELTKNLENILSDEEKKDLKNFEMEMTVKAKKKGFLGIKKNISFENTSFVEFFKIDGFDYDEAYADLSIGGRQRRLNISKPSDFSASYDVTGKVSINNDTNHPDFKLLNEEAINILNTEIIPNLNL